MDHLKLSCDQYLHEICSVGFMESHKNFILIFKFFLLFFEFEKETSLKTPYKIIGIIRKIVKNYQNNKNIFYEKMNISNKNKKLK